VSNAFFRNLKCKAELPRPTKEQIMNDMRESTDMRELTDTELDAVSGGLVGFPVAVGQANIPVQFGVAGFQVFQAMGPNINYNG